jgi:hypothetical protein
MEWMGNSNPFNGTVDLDLLPQIPKGLQLLVARIGDLLILRSRLMEERVEVPPTTGGGR